MSETIPASMQKLRPKLGEIVATIEVHTPYGAVLLSKRDGLKILIDNRQETISEEYPTAGTVLTAFNGETIKERAFGGFDKEAIASNARELAAECTNGNLPNLDVGPKIQDTFVTPMEIDPLSLSLQEKKERLRDLQNRIKKLDARIVNARVDYRETREVSIFRNRNTNLAQTVQRVILYTTVTVAKEGEVQFNYQSKAVTAGWEALTYSDDELQTTVDQAIALLDAQRIEPGEYTVVTAPAVSGTLCHESFGHGVEADMFLKERAKAASYLDRKVGSPLVNIVDDPSVPGGFGSYFFDDEGLPAKPTKIVEQGVFRRGLTDFYSAHKLKIARTANGRRQDFSRKAYARMSNTFFERGSTPVSDLFQQVKDGIYVEKMASGMEDPKGWGIQVTCPFGREIKRGEFTGRMFAPIVISGYVPDVLESISCVGDDFALQGGFCGKGHKERAIVSAGGPHLILKARLG